MEKVKIKVVESPIDETTTMTFYVVYRDVNLYGYEQLLITENENLAIAVLQCI